MMTPKELDEIEKIYMPYKLFPMCFPQYPEVDALIQSVPSLCKELRKAWAQLEIAKHALRFYSDGEHVPRTIPTISGPYYQAGEEGRRAKEALEKIESME